MLFFDKTKLLPPDGIFSLTIAFKMDPRPFKVNLGVGAYRTSELKAFVPTCIRKAEEELTQALLDKEYTPIDGDGEFLSLARNLFLGTRIEQSTTERAASIQTIGGTGALRIAADFLGEQGIKKMYIPEYTWPNHKNIFLSSGLITEDYPYFDLAKQCLNYNGMREFITKMIPGSTIILQVSCHNPSGFDPDKKQWKELAELISERQLLPFFDCAYQGFGEGIEEDVWAIRHFAQAFEELIVAYSFSKNFGLYGERVGALWVKTQNSQQAASVLSQMKRIARGAYSNPPIHGARLVKQVLQHPELKGLWEMEVGHMRERIKAMRHAFCESLKQKGAPLSTEAFSRGKGMFVYLGFSNEIVDRLIKDFAIYMPAGGRINLAGLTHSNLDYVVDSILAAIK